MGSRSVGSGIPGVVAASGRASGAPDCGVGAEAPPIEGVDGVGAGWGTGSGLGTGSDFGFGRLSDGPASSFYLSCWRSVRSSPRSFSTFPL